MLKIIEKMHQHHAKLTETLQSIIDNRQLFEDLEKLDVDLTYGYGELNLCFTGDTARLRAVWLVLRRHGYEPQYRPTNEDKTRFCTWWHKESAPTIWMSFTSSVCTRVQVGTRTVEEPVYEVHCGEAIEAPSELAELGV